MHSTLVRAQNVFGFFTTVAAFVAALIALSVVLFPQTPSASIKLRNVQVVRGRPHYHSTKKEQYAHIKFDLDADLSTLFNWNTKQIFLYITATYPSTNPTEPPSQAVIWDAILPGLAAPWHQNQYIHPTSTPLKSKPKSKSPTADTSYRSSVNASIPGLLHLPNQRPKYQITDATGIIANRTDAVLELGWNVQPWVGALVWANERDWWGGRWKALRGGRSERFTFPEVRGAKKAEDLGTVKGGEGNRGRPA